MAADARVNDLAKVVSLVGVLPAKTASDNRNQSGDRIAELETNLGELTVENERLPVNRGEPGDRRD